ncbi:hypothetical protein Tco_0876435 [Tanacetum coccineum]|uniref:Integrase, catalytic region, zinc finger, CCHC-type, peptidase aspartic, catalytic n=1 Tax=Tanacetum coccineum TaxID=301880 RepID=A0ABQ5BXC2_9ASTR
MILESVESGPLIWPSIVENGFTRPKKYSELSATKELQADCDIKATNIILQGLPPEFYPLERECKLYDELDKFAYKKGESLREFYLRFSLLLNDMDIYNMKLEQFQVNTMFLNTFPPEWSKFVTDVKLKGDDPIDAINHMMSFFTAVVTSRYPTTNNQSDFGDELNTAKVALMANLSHYGSDALSEVHNHDNVNNDMTNQDVQAMPSSEQSNVVATNLENKSVNDTLTAELERYKEQVKVLKEGHNVELRSHDNVSDLCAQKTNPVVIPDSEGDLTLAEESSVKTAFKTSRII